MLLVRLVIADNGEVVAADRHAASGRGQGFARSMVARDGAPGRLDGAPGGVVKVAVGVRGNEGVAAALGTPGDGGAGGGGSAFIGARD